MQVKHTRRRSSHSSSGHRRHRPASTTVDCLYHHPDAKSSLKVAQRLDRRSKSRGDAKSTVLTASSTSSHPELESDSGSQYGVSKNKTSVSPFFTVSAQGAMADSAMKPLALPAVGRTIYSCSPLPKIGRTIYDVIKPGARGNNDDMNRSVALSWAEDETNTDLRDWMTSWERRMIAHMNPEERKQSATVQLALQEASRKMKAHWQVQDSPTSEQQNTIKTEDPEDMSCDSSSTSAFSSGASTPSASWSSASSDCSGLSSFSDSSERSSALWADMSDRLKMEYATMKMFDELINAEAYQEMQDLR